MPSSEFTWNETAIRDLPEPVDYFDGLKATDVCYVDNVLAFSRLEVGALTPDPHNPHFHGRCLWVIPLHGEATMICGGRALRMRPGDRCLMSSFTPHSYVGEEQDGFLWLFISFDTVQASRLVDLSCRRIRTKREADQAFQACLHAIQAGQAGPACLQLALATELLNHQPRTTEGEGDALVRAVHRWVDGRGYGDWGLKQLAQDLGWSESHLRTVFRQRSGFSLGRYVAHLRLVRATRMLQDPRHPITDIALACGYQTSGNFSRAFRAAMGVTPSAYRRSKTQPPCQ